MLRKKYVMTLLCLGVALSLWNSVTIGANILFISSMSEEHMPGDDALKAFIEGLGHTVTYFDDGEDEATSEAAAAAADMVFLSESVSSGEIRTEITEIETPMVITESWGWDEMGLIIGGWRRCPRCGYHGHRDYCARASFSRRFQRDRKRSY